MTDLKYHLGYFKDQMDLWSDVAAATRALATQLDEVPMLKTWWPGLSKYGFGSFDESDEINQLQQALADRLAEGAASAVVLADTMADTAVAYAKMNLKNEDEAAALAQHVLHPVPPVEGAV